MVPDRFEKLKPISGMSLNVLIRRISYSGRATGHGVRHTISIILHEQGFNSARIELQLAHVGKIPSRHIQPCSVSGAAQRDDVVVR